MKLIFDNDDYEPLKDGETYKDKFIIINPDFFSTEYREAKYQLLFAQTGFGCDPEKLGGKIFGKHCDGSGWVRREYVLGVAKEKAIKEWEKMCEMSRDVFFKEGDD